MNLKALESHGSDLKSMIRRDGWSYTIDTSKELYDAIEAVSEALPEILQALSLIRPGDALALHVASNFVFEHKGDDRYSQLAVENALSVLERLEKLAKAVEAQ